MSEGEALQIGGTRQVYDRPQTLRVAEVFSDPPLNTIEITKQGNGISYDGGSRMAADGLYTALPDGNYRVGFRAHQLAIGPRLASNHAFPMTVVLTEITGSESFVYLERRGGDWIAVLPGVHEFEPGRKLDAAIDPNSVFIFDSADRLVAAPRGACRR